jgi:hypothetical protein
MFKIRGLITEVKQDTINTQKGEFEKMLITITESDTGFDHVHQFEIFGQESINVHKENIKKDKYATIEFYIKTNEYNGRYYNTLMVKNITPDLAETKLYES